MLSWDEAAFVEGFLRALLADSLLEPLDVGVQGQQGAEDRVCVSQAAVLVVVCLPANAVGQREPAQRGVTSMGRASGGSAEDSKCGAQQAPPARPYRWSGVARV